MGGGIRKEAGGGNKRRGEEGGENVVVCNINFKKRIKKEPLSCAYVYKSSFLSYCKLGPRP